MEDQPKLIWPLMSGQPPVFSIARCYVVAATLCAFVLAGCATTTKHTIIRDELPEWANEKIGQVMLESGEIVMFDADGGHYVDNDSGRTIQPVVVGFTLDHQPVSIEVERILEAHVEKSELDATQLVILGSLSIPAMVAALIGFFALFLYIIHPRF